MSANILPLLQESQEKIRVYPPDSQQRLDMESSLGGDATLVKPSSELSGVEAARQRLRVRAKAAQQKALEYEGDPFEEMEKVLPADLPIEIWKRITSGEYDLDLDD